MKTVLITGANKSIGFEVAKQLLDLGYFVYLGSRDLEKGIEAAKKLQSDKIEAIQIDISNQQSIETARKVLGGKINSLDVLINNAGISGGFPQAPTLLNIGTIKKVFDTNFF
jgi:NADP-dependent 3-hydroxy acid dehydrogenase YdfG